jgi:soluble lytic murein transglycosylase
MLRDHLSRFPQSDKRPSALYFLGRLTEASDGLDAARPLYLEILERNPNNFYTGLAESRLGGKETPKAERLDFGPSAANQLRISRSRLLSSAALSELAEGELRFAAREEGQPHVLAAELARQASSRGAPDQALRYIKGVFADYLSIPYEAAPADFWRLAFPLPFRWSLVRYAETNRLDVYLMAGLIRQESEFNPKAVSAADAHGLMQILPSVGRSLSRTLKTGAFRTSMLHVADYNIRLGTYYFRSLLDELDGSEEAALASYNGGKNRVDEWRSWATYREPAEFVETIPFTETRTYVQAVMRNAWLYRRIYGSAAATPAPPSPPARGSPSRRRSAR